MSGCDPIQMTVCGSRLFQFEREQSVRRGPKRVLSLSASMLFPALLLAGCVDHYLVHPRRPPAGAQRWTEVAVAGDLQMRLEWVRPVGRGPLPAVIVHPEAGHKAADMRGVLHDLAKTGYMAVAADYQRRTGTRWRENLVPWRDPADPRRVIDRVRAHPDVDPRRIGLLRLLAGRCVQPAHRRIRRRRRCGRRLLPGNRFRELDGGGRCLTPAATRFSLDPCRLPSRQRRTERRGVAGRCCGGPRRCVRRSLLRLPYLRCMAAATTRLTSRSPAAWRNVSPSLGGRSSSS